MSHNPEFSSEYFFNSKLINKRITEVKRLILYMVPRYLSSEERRYLKELTIDPKWCAERALTSYIGQNYLGVGFFHPRKDEIHHVLSKYQLPFRLVHIKHPAGVCKLYFLFYTGDSEPLTAQEVELLFYPPLGDEEALHIAPF